MKFKYVGVFCLLLGLGVVLIPGTGQCFYNPNSGRWLSRDPAGEKGGRNLYAFVRNTLGVDPLGLAQLHYIDHPKWEVVDLNAANPFIHEFLWVGHYLTFDASDASQLGNRGVLLVSHRSVANITDCVSRKSVQPVSHNWFFANRFTLNSDGTIPGNGANNGELFTDDQFHVFTQIGNFSMAGMYNRYSGSAGGRFTKGSIHSTMELRVISESSFSGDGWDTYMIPGYDDTNINGHELGRTYWGRMADSVPGSWGASKSLATITMDFEWNDCALACGGGNATWNFKISPWLTERGAQRWRYRDTQWSAVDLALTPSRQ